MKDKINIIVAFALSQSNQQQQIDKLTDQVSTLSATLSTEKDIYDKKLQDIQDINEKLQEKLDEIEIGKAREEWIKNNIDLGVVYVFGSGLGISASVGIMVGMTIFGLLADPMALPLMLGGAIEGQSFLRKFETKELKEALSRVEKEYLEKNPDASKRDAFEYAKKTLEELHKQARYLHDESSSSDYS